MKPGPKGDARGNHRPGNAFRRGFIPSSPSSGGPMGDRPVAPPRNQTPGGAPKKIARPIPEIRLAAGLMISTPWGPGRGTLIVSHGLPLLGPEGVKKSAWVFFPSFRRKPESSIFKPLRTAWTPVFTGVTTKRQFFHTFPE